MAAVRFESVKSVFAPYLPRLVRAWAAEEAGPTARALEGTLLSADISGFTALSEQLAAKGKAGAEELILVLSGVFEGLIGIAHRRGGDVLKFRGDALLLLFDGAGHEARACRAASEMQWFLAEAAPTASSAGPVALRMSVGIRSGTATFFVAGSTHRELLVTGPAATETILLEDAASAGEILIGSATAAALEPECVGASRGDAFLLAEPPGADVPDPDVAHVSADDERLAAWVPEPLRAPAAVGAIEIEHRQVAVAFLRYSGVDESIRVHGVDNVSGELAALGSFVGNTCAEYGVTWLESDIDVDGGKLYLVAGAPSTSGDNEERLLRAVRAIVDGWDGALRLKAGVNRGHVFAGEIGMSDRRTYAVMGDIVNLAARLASRAQDGEIVVTNDVLERSRAQFEQSAEPFLVKGKERAVTAVRIGALAAARKRKVEQHELPLVGRDPELAQLRSSVEAARARSMQVVELVGPPGIGKSRLLNELKTVAFGFQELDTTCDPYAASAPYFAFRSMLRQLAGMTADRSAADAGAQLEAWLPAVMPDLAPFLPLLAIPFDADVRSTPEADAVDRAFRRERVHELVTVFLQRVLMMPTLIVFEDAQWMDDASQQLLLQIARDTTPRPWLICIARRDDSPPVAEGMATTIDVAPLAHDEAERLALAAARDRPVAQDVVDAIVERADGNPLFVQELVAASTAGRGVDLPETIEALLTERIDRLDPGDRVLLRYASVVGPSFDLDLLGLVLEDERVHASERDRWARLDEFVTSDDGDTLRFRQELFRTAAYQGLSFRRRREIHGRVADALVQRISSDDAGDLLSLHFLHAGRWQETWAHAATAARRAQSRYANVVAADLYERALEAADQLPDLEATMLADVHEALGDVCELFASYERAGLAYASALERASAPDARARLMLKSGVVRERVGDYDDALASYSRALALLGAETSSLPLKIELELATAGIRHRQGRIDETIEWAERAAKDAKTGGSLKSLAHAYYLLDLAYTTRGTPNDEYRAQALPIYRESGDLVGQASVLNNLGIGAYFEGRWGEALEFYRESGEVSRRAGDVVSSARANNNLAEILSDQGKLADAVEVFAEARRVWRAGRYPIGAQLATSNLGRAEARAGHFDEGLRLLEEARRGFAEIGAAAFELEARAREAECLVLAGRYHEAMDVCTDGLDRSEVIAGGEVARVSLERSLGYALAQGRRKAEAQPHLERSAQLARTLNLDYELALTLKALADTDARPDAAAESAQMLAVLGVEWVPSPPLP